MFQIPADVQGGYNGFTSNGERENGSVVFCIRLIYRVQKKEIDYDSQRKNN